MKINKLSCIGAGVLLAISGCATVKTVDYKSFDSAKVDGIPYHLPMAMMKVRAEVSRGEGNKYKDIDINSVPILVPDPKNRYYLNSPNNMLFTSKHKIVTENGLLSSISTEDDGVTGDIAMALVDSATSILKIKSGAPGVAGSESGDAEPKSVFLNGHVPLTPQERRYALNSFSFNTFEFAYLTLEHQEVLPGTDRLLLIKSEYDIQSTSSTGLDSMGENTPQSVGEEYSGVVARTLVPARFSNSLIMDKNRLYRLRYDALSKEIARLSKIIDGEEAAYAQTLKNENETCGQIKEYPTGNRGSLNLDVIRSAANDVTDSESTKKQAYAECISAIQQTEGFRAEYAKHAAARDKYSDKRLAVEGELCKDREDDADKTCTSLHVLTASVAEPDQIIFTQEQGAALVPDLNKIVRIPIERAPFGKTTNKLTFEKGVLTEFESDKPSAGLAIAQMVADVLEAAVSIPAELIQFKIDTTDMSKELIEAQVEYENELDKLQGTQKEIADIGRRTKLIEAELGLENLQDQQSGIQYKVTLNNRLAKLAESEKGILENQVELDKQIEALRQLDVSAQINRNEKQVELIKSNMNVADAHQIAAIDSQIKMIAKQNQLLQSEIALIKSELEKDDLTNERKNALEQRIDVLRNQTQFIEAQTENLRASKVRMEARKSLNEGKSIQVPVSEFEDGFNN